MSQIGSRPVTAPGRTAKPKNGIAIVDCDVHHNFRHPTQLLPYLSKFYQEHLLDQGLHLGGYPNIPIRSNRVDLKGRIDEAIELTPKNTGGDPRDFNFTLEFMQEELLDVWDIDVAVLTGPPVFYGYSGLPDVDWAAALCRAFNDWTIEHWLDKDERVVNAILISPSDPPQAVEEINRLADRKDTVAVMVPMGTSRPFGNRFYHPIWEACEAHGLPVISHIGGGGGANRNVPTPVGHPSYYMESRMSRPYVASTQATSLIIEGVFEKFPNLKFALIEVQQMWAVPVMWHLDTDWKALRDQTPWLKRLPSEYFREHIRIGSQPMHETEKPEQMYQMLEMIHAEETLIFCSDFPHFDWNDPVTVLPKLPDDVKHRIFAQNALDILRMEDKS